MTTSCAFVVNGLELSWSGHYAAALSRKCDLASVHSIDDWLKLKDVLGQSVLEEDAHIWMGGMLEGDRVETSSWTWSDGSHFSNKTHFWMDGEPNNYWGFFGTENRMAARRMGADQYGWNDLMETEKLPGAYLCCDFREQREEFCTYSTSLEKLSWFDHQTRVTAWSNAHQKCHLASVRDAGEEEQVIGAMNASLVDFDDLDVSFWLGGSNTGVPGQTGMAHWDWADNSLFFFENWMNGEPNNFGDERYDVESRLSIRSIGGDTIGWNDNHAAKELPAIYQCCKSAVDVRTSLELPRGGKNDNQQCWFSGDYSYGVASDGACDDARVLSKHRVESETACHQRCASIGGVDKNGCGGWEFDRKQRLCRLKSAILHCAPTVARAGSSYKDTSTGINGCVDPSSQNIAESSAWDLTTTAQQDNGGNELELLNCSKPRCTSPKFYGGTWKGDTFLPRECWYKHLSVEDMVSTNCEQDRWIIVSGGSNSLAFFNQLVNYFVPIQDHGSPESFLRFGELHRYPLIDIVFQPNALPITNPNARNDLVSSGILHLNLKTFCEIDETIPCNWNSLDFHGGTKSWEIGYLEAIENGLQQAPHAKGATRMTLVVSHMWSNIGQVLHLAGGGGATNGWENSKRVFYGQSMIWYTCFLDGWCEIPELQDMLPTFRRDLDGVMEAGTNTCATDKFDCFFASHAFPTAPKKMYRDLSNIMADIVNRYDWAFLIDFNAFAIRTEIVDTHITPALSIPTQAMIWNTVCDIPDAEACPEAIQMSPSCFSVSECGKRGGNSGTCRVCLSDSVEKEWACINERQCHFDILDPIPLDVLAAGPSFFARYSEGDTSTPVQCFNVSSAEYFLPTGSPSGDDKCYGRIWCGTATWGWVLGSCLLVAGMLAVHFQTLRVPKSSNEDKLRLTTTGKTVPEPVLASNGGPEREMEMEIDEEEVDDDEIEGLMEIIFEDEHDPENSVFQAHHSTQESPQVEKTTPRNIKDHIHALGTARIVASLHIVVGHLKAKGVVADFYFFGWGFTWVPWFFLLSGYVLTHARLNSSRPDEVDGPYNHVAKRLSTIFPMYAFGVVLSMMIRLLKQSRLPSLSVLLGQSFLLQAWIPQWTEHSLLTQCWFLSSMVAYWMVFSWVYKVAHSLSLMSVCVSLLGLSLLPWLVVFVPVLVSSMDFTWYREHKWGQTDAPVDIWTIMLKFNPVFYFHIFLFGVLLAVLRHHIKTKPRTHLMNCLRSVTYAGATFGYIGLVLVFSIEHIQPVAWKLSTRLSVLLPLQGLVLLGLSPLPGVGEWQDPVARLFALAPSWVGDVSYCQYILQFAMYEFFPQRSITSPAYFFALMGASMLCYVLIQKPAADYWRKCLPRSEHQPLLKFLPSCRAGCLIFVPSLALAFVLAVAKNNYRPSTSTTYLSTNSTNHTLAAPFIRVGPEAIDMELNWTFDYREGRENQPTLINPSMLFVEDGNGQLMLVRAARVHALHETFEDVVSDFEGNPVKTEQTMYFESDIAVDMEPFTGDLSVNFDDDVSRWGLDGSGSSKLRPIASTKLMTRSREWKPWRDLCEPIPSYSANDQHLVRKVVEGPEDPKLISLDHGQDWGITFSSLPPVSQLPPHEATAESCRWSDVANMQMYLTTNWNTLFTHETRAGIRLQCGDVSKPEKNWIAFTYKGDLHYVSSVYPHTVRQVNINDGSCSSGTHETISKELERVVDRGVAVRGSATAVRYSDSEFLALLHTKSSNGYYSTMAYTFQAQPPFGIRRISKPLPLQGGGRAFASSLVVRDGKVIIGYGEADRVSRVLVMSTDYLDLQFDWCK